MSTPLTRYIKTNDATTFPSEEIRGIIGRVLKSKMQKRNLWKQPPCLLGYPDHGDWNDKYAFFDILNDCIISTVLDRFETLQKSLQTKETIDGVVFLNISHFIQERQQAHDPEGFAIFKNVEAVLINLNKSGTVRLENLREEKKIRNETTCTLTDIAIQTSFPDYSIIKQIVSRHEEFGTILNHLATLCDTSQRNIAKLILHLKTEGITTFRVKDLVDCLKGASRRVIVEMPSSDIISNLPSGFSALSVSYDDATDATIDIGGIQESIKKEIDKLKHHKKVKSRLHCLLTTIMCSIADGKDVSITEIANEMGYSKSTISEDWTLLKSLMKKI